MLFEYKYKVADLYVSAFTADGLYTPVGCIEYLGDDITSHQRRLCSAFRQFFDEKHVRHIMSNIKGARSRFSCNKPLFRTDVTREAFVEEDDPPYEAWVREVGIFWFSTSVRKVYVISYKYGCNAVTRELRLRLKRRLRAGVPKAAHS